MKVCWLLSSLMLATSVAAETTQWHTAVAVGTSVVNHHMDQVIDETHAQPIVSLGWVRPLNESWQLESSFDLLFKQGNQSDQAKNLLSWKLLEIGYRLSENWAFTTYGGISRYYRERPAFGYSLGAGAKMRVNEQWFFVMELNSTTTDTSSGVPRDEGTRSKDNFKWFTLAVEFHF